MNTNDLLYLALIATLLSACQQTESALPLANDKQQSAFQLSTYVCYKTNQAIRVDGKLEEPIWQEAPATTDFQDIEGKLKPPPLKQTYVKMLWDDTYLYFGAYLEETHIWANMTDRDDPLYKENAFEIFLDPDGDTHNYCELEINAKNTVWDLLMLRPYREDNLPKVQSDWNIEGLQTAVHMDGTLNASSDTDRSWTIEIAIPWKALPEITPVDYLAQEGVQWRVNFARVNWQADIINDRYHKRKDSNNKNSPASYWVWSPQQEINMHMPERWGYVQFSEQIAGQGEVEFILSPNEEIKLALRELYYQQSQYFKENGQYLTELDSLILPKVHLDGYDFQPLLSTKEDQYNIVVRSASGSGYWRIRNDGKIVFYQI